MFFQFSLMINLMIEESRILSSDTLKTLPSHYDVSYFSNCDLQSDL